MTDGTAHGQRQLSARMRGVVQGVGFRMFALREARRLMLSGWVRNCRDGSVEVLAEGREEQLRQLLAALRCGPSGARVEEVETAWAAGSGELHGFSIRDDG